MRLRPKKTCVVPSRLLPEAFAKQDHGRPLQVLDVSTGDPRTLEFLEPIASRVSFLDLSRCRDDFSSKLATYPDTLFNVCLFWDFLHRLTSEQLHRLSHALRPHIHSDTRAHAIVRFQGEASYNIAAMDQVAVTPNGSERRACWSYVDFAQYFDALRVTQDNLTPDGHHELLLEAD